MTHIAATAEPITDTCKNCGGPIVHSTGPWWRHIEQHDASRCRIPTLSGLDSIEFALPANGPIVPLVAHGEDQAGAPPR